MVKTAYLFPGQGAQHVGMGKDLYEAAPAARSLFDLAEEVCGLPLTKLCFQGPQEDLARTDVCQAAIFTVSAAVWTVMHDLLSSEQLQAISPTYLAGLSLGEYTALWAAGAMDFQTGVELVARRGQLMQEAATAQPSGMVSILGLDETKARELCQAASNGQVLTCANFNCPGQIVISGHIEACQRAVRMAEQFGATGAVPLKVAGAFHSEIMRPAAEAFTKTLREVKFNRPGVKVVSNVDAEVYADVSEIKEKLAAQLVSPVRWQQGMELLVAEGVQELYEVGPGRVLAGLMRRVSPQTPVTCLNGLSAIEKLTKAADRCRA